MNDYVLTMLVYCVLQVVSLVLLPRWWKLAALPALYVVWPILHERAHPTYMGDVFMMMFAVYACGYLLLAWAVFGVTTFIRRQMKKRS
jgi:hypothetical protein